MTDIPLSGAARLRQLIAGDHPVKAPLVINPMTAKLAEAAGFQALYLGGGALGYVKCVTEANLSATEMAQACLDIRTVTSLPIILDGGTGWGDPMHIHRTIGISEAAGFAAIEIEDQIVPKRAHHHIGIEHLVSTEMMVAKIEEAVAARRDPDFIIIGRTNASHIEGLDAALRRGEAYRKAGADMLWVLPTNIEEARIIGERLGGPLMCMNIPPKSGSGETPLGPDELFALGYRIVADGILPLMAAHKAWRLVYEAMANDTPGLAASVTDNGKEWALLHKTVDLAAKLAVEKRTVER
jgi:2-methylisocitrate lyase-like PEP mutase family enzyme